MLKPMRPMRFVVLSDLQFHEFFCSRTGKTRDMRCSRKLIAAISDKPAMIPHRRRHGVHITRDRPTHRERASVSLALV